MLPTFVIGLREGLEAALIVSIIATFLRRNGASLRGMWAGVGAGVLVSIAVGVALDLLERSLPQAQQEGLETVIGVVAVVFVTGMVLWMRTHARHLKSDLETAAADAIASGTTTALAVMAFLAVVREGFETSVFLLATFEHATSAPAAVSGAVLGIAVAIGLGGAIYAGGLRLDLRRFFSWTGVFLVLVAAGLVLSAFRTAHEAGWVNVGQGTTVDLSWLAPAGSVRAAIVTGVLGMPADPRLVELLAWACYLVPLLLLLHLPARLVPGPSLAQRLRVGGAGVLCVAAVALAVLVPAARTPSRDLPDQVDVTTLLTYTGDRVPVGLDVKSAPGPYDAVWREHGTSYVLTISDGGLQVPRTFTVQVAAPAPTDPGRDVPLWRAWFPAFLTIVAAGLLGQYARRRRSAGAPPSDPPPPVVPKGHHVAAQA
ncbi:iron uptake transporter permease EfeU [Nocardioides sp. MH1]|uniref:iron uptake transporter permease EfeU n=1 Tax=Nocardioides sp. MH1 TaxID=3242490 RepID=UPI00352188E2